MNNAATFVERRKMHDRRSMKNRRQAEQISEPVQHGLLFKLLSTLLVACIGLAAYKALGLYDAMDSNLGQLALGSFIAWYFVACFRHALYRYGQ